MNSMLLTDSYKLGHADQYSEGTTLVFSNFTPRSDNHAAEAFKGGVVVFGVQLAFKKLMNHFDENFFNNEERISTEDLSGFKKTNDFKVEKNNYYHIEKSKTFSGVKLGGLTFKQAHNLGFSEINERITLVDSISLSMAQDYLKQQSYFGLTQEEGQEKFNTIKNSVIEANKELLVTELNELNKY